MFIKRYANGLQTFMLTVCVQGIFNYANGEQGI